MILIVDFGSQTTHLIGRRLRQLGVNVEYITPEEAPKHIKQYHGYHGKEGKTHDTRDTLKGIILSGGPSSVYEPQAPTISPELLQLGLPVLGICYGWQLMAKLLGGEIHSTTKEYGPAELELRNKKQELRIVKNVPQTSTVWLSHGDTVTKLPDNFEIIGQTATVPYTFVQDEDKRFFGMQFHPEVQHTKYGLTILENFAQICQEELHPISLDPQKIIHEVKQTVGNKKVICAVSGGVDSSVAAFLIGKAIGHNLIPVYVDSGLMREGTEQIVRSIFTKLIHADLVIVNARERFLTALQGITDPEQKRKIIGKLYVDIFQEEAAKHQDAQFLGQGTIYSDVIESKGSKHASHIKSHHNVGGLPKDMTLTLLEPMRNYYKDEVREIGKLAGLPEDVIMQHPFPGPGYAVRIRGEVTEERLAQVKQADHIIVEEIKKAGLYETLFQCFAVMTGAYSTAVKGDARVFAEVVGIRAYESTDVMTSHWAYLPHELLQTISSRIVNEVPHVSRVVYDITTKPPATMEWE